MRGKNRHPWILVLCALFCALCIGGCAAADPSRRRIEQATVERSNIESSVVGTGSLTYAGAKEVYIPNGVDVTSVYCSTGETVEQGALLASVDRTQCEVAMSNTYAQIASTDEQMENASSKSETVSITAPVGGRIVQLNASKGSSVLDVTSQTGSLLVISPHGRMGAQITTDEEVQPGQTVTLFFPDDTQKTATVENVTEDAFTVALVDSSLTVGETVRAQVLGGKELGTGTITALDGVTVVGPSGTVDTVSVSLNEKIDKGKRLLTVRTDTPSAEYLQLQQQRDSLTKRYDALTEIYKAGGLKAPMGGIVVSSNLSVSSQSGQTDSGSSVSGFPFSSAQGAFSAFGAGMSAPLPEESAFRIVPLGSAMGGTDMLLATSPDTEDVWEDTEEPSEPEPDPMPEEPSAAPEPSEEPEWPTQRPMEPTEPVRPIETAQPIPTAMPTFAPRGIPALTLPLIPPIATLPLQQRVNILPVYTGTVTWSPEAEKAAYETVYTARVTLEAMDGFYFDQNCEVTLIGTSPSLTEVSEDGKTLTICATYPKTTGAFSLEGIDWSALENLFGTAIPDLESLMQLLTSGSLGLDSSSLLGSLGGLDMSSLSGLSGLSALNAGGVDLSALEAAQMQSALAGSSVSMDRTDAYPDSSTACTIAPSDKMQLQIAINQMDILSVKPGMPCKITVDALEGQEFDGTVEEVSLTAGTDGSYTVRVTVEKTDEMLSGMTASAIITTSSTQNVLTLPVAAVQEDGNRTFVYTSSEGDKGLGGEVDVTTGVSNGTTVEILSGLEQGQTIYYEGESDMQRMMRMMTADGSTGSEQTVAPAESVSP